MGEQNFSLEESVERYKQANADLAKVLGVPDYAETLNQNIPDTIEELNEEAYRIEHVSMEAERYMDAHRENAEAKGLNFDGTLKYIAISQLPHTADDVAKAAYDLEQVNPEIKRLMEATVDSYAEKGLPFDEEARNLAIASTPATADEIARKSYDIEQNLSDETRANRHETVVQKAIEEYKADFQSVNGKSLEESKSLPPSYDVIAEGQMPSPIGEELRAGFARADAHEGPKSLEVLRIEQIAQVNLPPVSNDPYAKLTA